MSGSAAGAVLRPGGSRPTAPWSRQHWVVSIVIVIAAVASVAYGVVLIAGARELLAHHRTTGGVVTAVSPDVACGDYTCSDFYDWTVRYQPPGSGSLTFTSSNGNATPVGTHVLVYYLDRDPGIASLDPGTGEQDQGIFLIALGIALGMVGFVIAYLIQRSQAGLRVWPRFRVARSG